MKNERKYSGGYTGLIALLIAVAIIGYLSFKIWQKTDSAGLGGGDIGSQVESGKNAIDAAKDAKSLIENTYSSEVNSVK